MKETNWNNLAEEYARRDFPRNDWIYGYQPVLELLGNIHRKRMLDYGCGSGKFSRILANKGAEVIAVDPTEKMLELARAKDCRNITYKQIVGNDFSFVESIDEAVAAYVLCGRSSDKEAAEIIQTIYGKLRTNGSFIVLDPHPNMRLGKTSGSTLEICLEGMTKPVLDYWRPVEKYVFLLEEGSFTIDTVLEPKDQQGTPQMLIIRGRKCIK